MLILQPLLSAPLSSCNQKEESELLCILIDMYSKCEKLCLVIVLLLPQLLSVRIMYQTSFGFGFFFWFFGFVCVSVQESNVPVSAGATDIVAESSPAVVSVAPQTAAANGY